VSLWENPGPFSTAEVAAACRVSQRYVQKTIAAGALEARQVGRVIRVPATAARAFAVALGAEPPSGVGVVGEVRDIRGVRLVRDVRIDLPRGRA
jgi:excisionase family DNA binding protein